MSLLLATLLIAAGPCDNCPGRFCPAPAWEIQPPMIQAPVVARADPWWEWAALDVPTVYRVVTPPTFTMATVTAEVAQDAPLGWVTDYSEALRIAKETNRPILFYWSSRTCAPCARFSADVWSATEVRRAVGGRYVLCYLSIDDRPNLARACGVASVPAVLLTSPRRVVQRSFTGYRSRQAFVEWLVAPGQVQAAPDGCMASPISEGLTGLARSHAAYMASVRVQGHQRWDSRRVAALQAEPSLSTVTEICAETWPWQDGVSEGERWDEYMKCWRQSPGHWSVARVRHKMIGMADARGSNGVWYGVVIAGD